MKVIQNYHQILSFVEEDFIKNWKSHWPTNPSNLYGQICILWTKTIYLKIKLQILEHNANSVQLDILDKIIVYNLAKFYIK